VAKIAEQFHHRCAMYAIHSGGWAMFRNTIRCSPICQFSAISFTGATANQKITRLLDRHVRSLSRGENQRVVIARALLSAPQLLLLDEPLTSLDAKLKNAILQQLQTLHREFGIPMLFVTHDPMEATAICEEVLLLQSGRIIGRGDPAKLLG
jgi:molybdate transport system ATP-binding protein